MHSWAYKRFLRICLQKRNVKKTTVTNERKTKENVFVLYGNEIGSVQFSNRYFKTKIEKKKKILKLNTVLL